MESARATLAKLLDRKIETACAVIIAEGSASKDPAARSDLAYEFAVMREDAREAAAAYDEFIREAKSRR